jgi:hypothetical protein
MATVIVTSSAPVWVIAADFCVGMMAMSARANDCSVVISPRTNKDVGSAHTSTAASSWTRAWRTGSVKKNSERMPCLPMTCSERASDQNISTDGKGQLWLRLTVWSSAWWISTKSVRTPTTIRASTSLNEPTGGDYTKGAPA